METLPKAPEQGIDDAAHAPAVSVFLSYSRDDVETTRWLQAQLTARGIAVFRDIDDTLPGELWWKRLTELIAAAEAVVFVLSPRSAASKVCADEVEFAQSLNKRIFPAVIAPVDWSRAPKLGRFQAVSLIGNDARAAGVEQLVRALNTDLDWVRTHTRLLDRALRWQTKHQPTSELLTDQALEEAESWLVNQPATAEAPTPLHQSYIKTSRDAERARQARNLAEAEARRAAMQAERDRALRSQSIFLAKQSREQTARKRFDLGIKLALVALPRSLDEPDRPWTQTAENALLAAVAGQRFRLELGAPRQEGEEALSTAAIAPDGRRAALAYGTHVVLWDLDAGEEITTLRADLHSSVACACFSPDSRLFVVTYVTQGTVMYSPGYQVEAGTERGGVIEIVTSDDGAMVNKFQVPGHESSHAAFFQSGRRLLFATDRYVALIDTQTWQGDVTAWGDSEQAPIPPYAAVAFSLDETRVAVATTKGHVVMIDTTTPSLNYLFQIGDKLSGLDFLEVKEGSTRIVVGTAAKVLAFEPDAWFKGQCEWGASKGDPLVAMAVTAEPPGAIAITQQGRVRTFRVDAREASAEMQDETSDSTEAIAVRSAHFTASGTAAIVEHADGGIEHWALPGRTRCTILSPDGERTLIAGAFAEQTKLALIASSDDCVRFWEPLADQIVEQQIDTGKRDVVFAAFRPGRSEFAIAFDDGTIELRDPVRDEAPWHASMLHDAPLRHLAFDRTGMLLVSTSLDKTAIVHSIDGSRPPLRLVGHENDVEFAAFSPDGTLVVTGSRDCTFRLWNSASGALVHVLTTPPEHLDPIHNASINPHAAFTADQRQIITVTSGDGNAVTQPALVWDAASGDLLHALPHPNGAIWQVIATPDDRHVITASYDCTAAIWDLRTGLRVRTLSGHTSPVVRVALSHSGELLTTASSDGELRVWQMPDGRLIHRLHTVEGNAQLVASHDGNWICTCGRDGDDDSRIELWDVREGTSVLSIAVRDERVTGPDALRFSPDGRGLLARTRSGKLVQWSLPPTGQALIDLGWRRAHKRPGEELLSTEQRIRFSIESA